MVSRPVAARMPAGSTRTVVSSPEVGSPLTAGARDSVDQGEPTLTWLGPLIPSAASSGAAAVRAVAASGPRAGWARPAPWPPRSPSRRPRSDGRCPGRTAGRPAGRRGRTPTGDRPRRGPTARPADADTSQPWACRARGTRQPSTRASRVTSPALAGPPSHRHAGARRGWSGSAPASTQPPTPPGRPGPPAVLATESPAAAGAQHGRPDAAPAAPRKSARPLTASHTHRPSPPQPSPRPRPNFQRRSADAASGEDLVAARAPVRPRRPPLRSGSVPFRRGGARLVVRPTRPRCCRSRPRSGGPELLLTGDRPAAGAEAGPQDQRRA